MRSFLIATEKIKQEMLNFPKDPMLTKELEKLLKSQYTYDSEGIPIPVKLVPQNKLPVHAKSIGWTVDNQGEYAKSELHAKLLLNQKAKKRATITPTPDIDVDPKLQNPIQRRIEEQKEKEMKRFALYYKKQDVEPNYGVTVKIDEQVKSGPKYESAPDCKDRMTISFLKETQSKQISQSGAIPPHSRPTTTQTNKTTKNLFRDLSGNSVGGREGKGGVINQRAHTAAQNVQLTTHPNTGFGVTFNSKVHPQGKLSGRTHTQSKRVTDRSMISKASIEDLTVHSFISPSKYGKPPHPDRNLSVDTMLANREAGNTSFSYIPSISNCMQGRHPGGSFHVPKSRASTRAGGTRASSRGGGRGRVIVGNQRLLDDLMVVEKVVDEINKSKGVPSKSSSRPATSKSGRGG